MVSHVMGVSKFYNVHDLGIIYARDLLEVIGEFVIYLGLSM